MIPATQFSNTKVSHSSTTTSEGGPALGMHLRLPVEPQAVNKKAKKIGAVNTIKFTANGLIGYNTDAYGFKNDGGIGEF